MKPALFFLLPFLACAQVETPRLGVLVDGQSRLRSLYGIPGALTLSLPESDDEALSAAASQTCAVSKTSSSVRIQCAGKPVQTMEAPPGPALFAFLPDGRLAAVYYESTSDLLRFPDFTPRLFPGVVSLTARFLLLNHDGALSRYDLAAETETPLPEATLPAVLLDDGAVLDRRALPESEIPSRIDPFSPGLLLIDRARLFRIRDAALFDIPREAPLP